MSDVFHLGLRKDQLNNATLAIIPGDPERVKVIAETMDNPRHLSTVREFTTYLAELNGQPVVVTSTGIGGPSTSIAVEELAQLGITTFLRVGTTGAIQPDIAVGDMIVTTASVRLDGASQHFAPIQYPAVASYPCTSALVQSTESLGLTAHVGVTASSDTFYPGQERYDTHNAWVPQAFRGSLEEWQQLCVLNYEMESATLFTMCAATGLTAGCIAGVIVNRTQQEIPDESKMVAVQKNAIQAVVKAAALMLA